MNILFLSEYFHPFAHGGTEWSVYYLIRGLLSQGQKAYLLTPNYGAPKRETWKRIEIIRFPFFKKIKLNKIQSLSPFWHNNPLTWLVTFFYISKVLEKKHIQIIHVNSKSMVPPALLAQVIFKIPVVVTLRDYYSLCSYGLCLTKERKYARCNIKYLLAIEIPLYLRNYHLSKNPNRVFHLCAALYSRIVSAIIRICIKMASARICISQKMQQIYAANGLLKTMVIYNTMDFQKKSINPKPQNSIIYIGRLTPGKGITLLVAAAEKLLISSPQLKLKVIGEGFLGNSLKSQIPPLLRRQVIFYSQVNYSKTLFYIRTALAVVVPSVWEEPFGRVALEALSQGIPVVATDRGGLPEIVRSGITGYITKPEIKYMAESLSQAIKNNQLLRKNIIDSYPDLRKTFSQNPVRQYLHLYNRLHKHESYK